MNRKALFICGVAERYKFTYLVAREIEKRFPIRPYYWIVHENMGRYLSEKGVSKEQVIYLKPEINDVIQDGQSADLENLKRIEAGYGIPDLMLYWEGMREHKGYSYEDSLKRMEAVFTVTENFFDRYEFEFAFLDTIVANMQMMFLLNLFERNQKPFYYIFSSKIPGRFVVSRGLEDRHLNVEKTFAEVKKRPLNEEEKRLAESFLREFRSPQNTQRVEDKKIKRRRLSDRERIGRGLYSIWEAYRFGTYKGAIRKHTFLGPLQYVSNRFISDLRAKLYKNLPLFQEPDSSKDYMLFFLHKQPEASTFVKAPFFLSQQTLVENIAKSLPVGVELYIKPHYNDFGGKPLRYYREFLCRPNVRLVKVDTNGKELVRHSLGVITITGTVGWEALLVGKPVISTGNMFYNMFDQVMNVTDMTQLPEKIKFALHTYKPDEELLKKFIVAMIQGSHKGYVFPPTLSRSVLVQENISNIVEGMAAEGIFEKPQKCAEGIYEPIV